MAKQRKGAPPAPPERPWNTALAGLAARMADLPPAPEPAASPPGARTHAPPPPARAVVRMERAGRGGRTVTVVEKLDLSPRDLEAWAGELKRALGCGGVVEGTALVLQGDARERVGAWLSGRGVRKVTVAGT